MSDGRLVELIRTDARCSGGGGGGGEGGGGADRPGDTALASFVLVTVRRAQMT